MSREGEQFLHNKDDQLQRSLPVELEQMRRARASHDAEYVVTDDVLPRHDTEDSSSQSEHGLGSDVHTKPAEKISDWMQVLERTHGHHDDPRVLERIKKSYHDQYVIKPDDVPESTFELEARIARNMGHGDIPITNEFRRTKTEQIISNQEESLDRWVDYLSSEDAIYPTWLKYWAFTSVAKMGKWEKNIETDENGNEHESARFAKRTKDTVAPFPPLNPRALALTLSAIETKANQRGIKKSERQPVENTSTRLDDSEFSQLLSSESFSQIYAQYLVELPSYSAEGLRETRGVWTKYDQGSDAQPLVDSLEGHPLEWCTAGIETARSQLDRGDFYVYYTLDDKEEATIPRVAIRMEDDQIAEVRGIAPKQELDPYIADIVSDKMQEFPDGEDYQRRAQDMQRLTDISEHVENGDELTSGDLRFLYEIDGEIESFGYAKDPRINELLEDRDTKADIGMLLNIPSEQIALTQVEALSGTSEKPILYYRGNIHIFSRSPIDGVRAPEWVSGSINFELNKSVDGFTFPRRVDGNLLLRYVTSIEGVTLPEYVGGHLPLDKVSAANGVVLPKTVGGELQLRSLVQAEDLTFPQEVGDNLKLNTLVSGDGLTLPRTVGGALFLNALTDAKGMILPEMVGSDVDLKEVKTADGLVLPEAIGGDLSLDSLTSAKGLKMPRDLGGSLNLTYLESADGLELPAQINGNLALMSLESSDGLNLPRHVRGDLLLDRLTSAEELLLPDVIEGDLGLTYLKSAEGLHLPRLVGGRIAIYSRLVREQVQSMRTDFEYVTY